MKRLLSCGIALILLVAGATVHAAEQKQYRAESSVIGGNAWESLVFEGKPSRYGTIILFGIPTAAAYDWPFAVYNASDEPLEKVVLKVYETVEGKKRTFDSRAHVFPLVIQPGEFGFGGANLQPGEMSIAGGPADGMDAVLTARPIEDRKLAIEGWFDLRVDDVEVSPSGEVSGVVILNHQSVDVNKVEVHVLCMEDSGIPMGYEWDILDRHLLGAGDAFEFESQVDVEWGVCDHLAFVSAIGKER